MHNRFAWAGLEGGPRLAVRRVQEEMAEKGEVVALLTVQELFRRVQWREVEAVLLERYGDEVENIPGLRGAFCFMRDCRPEPNPDGWCVEVAAWHEGEGDVVFDVHARRPKDGEAYGIDCLLLHEIASYFVSEETLASFPPAEAAAHILWEATWYGHTNEAILARRRELEECLEELERNPDTGISAEKVFRELEEEE